MKTKIFVILLSIVAVISFTALTNGRRDSVDNNKAQTYQARGGQTMTDPHQFD